MVGGCQKNNGVTSKEEVETRPRKNQPDNLQPYVLPNLEPEKERGRYDTKNLYDLWRVKHGEGD